MRFLLVILIGVPGVLRGQVLSSPYSIYGVGTLQERASSYNRALSMTGIGIRDMRQLNMLNPAAYTSIADFTQLTEMGFTTNKNILSVTDDVVRSGASNFSGVNMWFRFSKKWASTAGLNPYSNVNYNIQSIQNLGDSQALIQYEGTGGLSQIHFGTAYQITKNFSAGLNLNYLFGSIQKTELVLSGSATGTYVESALYVTKPYVDVGFQYSLPLKKNSTLTLGAIASSNTHLNSMTTVNALSSFTNGSVLYSETETSDTYMIPATIGAGLSYQTPLHTFAFDVKSKTWDQVTLGESSDFKRTTRFSLAYAYRNGLNVTDNYLKSIELRTGLFTQSNYLTVKGVRFSDWGGTVGIGLPVNNQWGMLGVTYGYFVTGTTANSLIKQQTHVFNLDVTIRDLWFIKRKFDK